MLFIEQTMMSPNIGGLFLCMAERDNEIPYSFNPEDEDPLGQMDEQLFISLSGNRERLQSLIDLFKSVRDNPSKAFGANPQELVQQDPHRQKELQELQTMDETPAEDHTDEDMLLIRDRLLAFQAAGEHTPSEHMLKKLLFQRHRLQTGQLNETDGKKMDRRGWATWKDRTDETKLLRRRLTEGLKNFKPSAWGKKTRDEVRRNLDSNSNA